MAKQNDNANVAARPDLIADIGATGDEANFLRMVAENDPTGFGYLVNHIYPTMRAHKAQTGNTLNLIELMESDRERFAKKWEDGPIEIERATDSPVYSWRNQMNAKYGPKAEKRANGIVLPIVMRTVDRLLDAVIAATPGLSRGRGRQGGKLAELRNQRPDTLTDAAQAKDRLSALDV